MLVSDTLNTPREVDEHLATLYGEHAKLARKRESVEASIYHQAGSRKQYYGSGRSRYTAWDMDFDAALAKVWELAADESYIGRDASEVLAKQDEVNAALEAKNDEIAEAEQLYTGWSRFFLVTSSNGHIHSSTHCKTCRVTTTYGWMPHLSGKGMSEAIEFFGPAAECLCSVCFPDAPVARLDGNLTQKQTDALLRGETPEAKPANTKTYCTGQYMDRDKPSRTGYYTGNWGTCPECGAHATLTSAHGPKLRKHEPKKA